MIQSINNKSFRTIQSINNKSFNVQVLFQFAFELSSLSWLFIPAQTSMRVSHALGERILVSNGCHRPMALFHRSDSPGETALDLLTADSVSFDF